MNIKQCFKNVYINIYCSTLFNMFHIYMRQCKRATAKYAAFLLSYWLTISTNFATYSVLILVVCYCASKKIWIWFELYYYRAGFVVSFSVQEDFCYLIYIVLGVYVLSWCILFILLFGFFIWFHFSSSNFNIPTNRIKLHTRTYTHHTLKLLAHTLQLIELK